MQHVKFVRLCLESPTPSLSTTFVRFQVNNGRIKWVLWSDLSQIKVLTHYALIFDNKGDNKLTVISGSGDHNLEYSSDPDDINIYGMKVVDGTYPIIDGQICAESIGDIRRTMRIILPGFADYIDNHPEIMI